MIFFFNLLSVEFSGFINLVFFLLLQPSTLDLLEMELCNLSMKLSSFHDISEFNKFAQVDIFLFFFKFFFNFILQL